MALSIALHQQVYYSVLDYLPPQFSDPHTSRYAYGHYAMDRSVPRPIRLKYVYSAILACFGLLGFTVLCFVWADDKRLKLLISALLVIWALNTLSVVRRFRDNDHPTA